jgi:hypothetical protein
MIMNSLTQKFIGALLRWLPFLLYASWVLIGYRILLENQVARPVQFRYVATGEFSINHLVSAEDIVADASLPWRDRIWLPKPVEFEGKYIAHRIGGGQSIELADLRPSPMIRPSPGNVAYAFSLEHQPSLGDILNAGASVGICSSSCGGEGANVLAVLCPAVKRNNCSVVLDLSPTQVARFSDPGKVQLVLK